MNGVADGTRFRGGRTARGTPRESSKPPKFTGRRTVRGWRTWLAGGTALAFLVLFLAFVAVLILADAFYIDGAAIEQLLSSSYIGHSLWMSVWTSVTTVVIALVFAIPAGYALSRFRFPLRVLADTLVDLPIVFPPLVAGLTLLVFFSRTALGRWIQNDLGLEFVFQPAGIVLCQFLVSASFAIRSAKTAFDEVDRRLESVALTLGCTPIRCFFRVSLPLAANGILTGAILTWARAFGLFGPLIIFVGSFRGRTEVLSTTIFLEQSVGNLELALTVALLMIAVALACLVAVRCIGGRTSMRY